MKKYILPALAALLVVAAVVIIVFVPKKSGSSSESAASVTSVSSAPVQENVIRIPASSLSSETVSFIRAGGDSKVELLARMGDDGLPKVALGTCQSCNGSPNAYYVQIEQYLRCNNCKLVFQLNILDSPGGGCHPISIDSEVILSQDESGIVIDRTALLEKYEYLFAKIADH